MPLLRAEPGGLRPILALDVVDHGALAPREQRWYHEPDTFTRPRWREREYVLRAVVAEILQASRSRVVPSTDIYASAALEETGGLDILFGSPPRRSVKILSVFREALGVSIGEDKERYHR